MALSGLSTRTVLTAEKLTFCRLSEYSSILEHTERMEACVNRAAANAVAVSAGRARSRWELKHRKMGKRYYVANYILHVLNTSHPSQGKWWLIIVRFWTIFTFLLLDMAAMHVFWQTICFHSSALWTATESPEKFEKRTHAYTLTLRHTHIVLCLFVLAHEAKHPRDVCEPDKHTVIFACTFAQSVFKAESGICASPLRHQERVNHSSLDGGYGFDST